MDAKKTVEFTQDRVVEDADGTVVKRFKTGKRYDLPVASADRWIRRGAAFDVDAPPEPADEGTGESADDEAAGKAAHGKSAGKAAHGNKKVP